MYACWVPIRDELAHSQKLEAIFHLGANSMGALTCESMGVRRGLCAYPLQINDIHHNVNLIIAYCGIRSLQFKVLHKH